MYTQVNEQQFIDAFREIRPENFSYSGLKALYDYLTELEDDIGEPIELDVIAICCDFSEMDLDNVRAQYDIEADDIVEASNELSEHTMVVVVTDNDTVVFQDF